MKEIQKFVNESLRNSKQYMHDAELALEYKDWTIEIDEEKDLIRIYDDKNHKAIKFWYNEETLQAWNGDEETLEVAHIFDKQK